MATNATVWYTLGGVAALAVGLVVWDRVHAAKASTTTTPHASGTTVSASKTTSKFKSTTPSKSKSTSKSTTPTHHTTEPKSKTTTTHHTTEPKSKTTTTHHTTTHAPTLPPIGFSIDAQNACEQQLLKAGDSGPCVVLLQILILRWQIRIGVPTSARLKVTGSYSEPTQSQVGYLQQTHGLPVTGMVDGATWRAARHVGG